MNLVALQLRVRTVAEGINEYVYGADKALTGSRMCITDVQTPRVSKSCCFVRVQNKRARNVMQSTSLAWHYVQYITVWTDKKEQVAPTHNSLIWKFIGAYRMLCGACMQVDKHHAPPSDRRLLCSPTHRGGVDLSHLRFLKSTRCCPMKVAAQLRHEVHARWSPQHPLELPLTNTRWASPCRRPPQAPSRTCCLRCQQESVECAKHVYIYIYRKRVDLVVCEEFVFLCFIAEMSLRLSTRTHGLCKTSYSRGVWTICAYACIIHVSMCICFRSFTFMLWYLVFLHSNEYNRYLAFKRTNRGPRKQPVHVVLTNERMIVCSRRYVCMESSHTMKRVQNQDISACEYSKRDEYVCTSETYRHACKALRLTYWHKSHLETHFVCWHEKSSARSHFVWKYSNKECLCMHVYMSNTCINICTT